MHTAGLRPGHSYRSIAAAPLAFSSDLWRTTNANPRWLQLTEYVEPIAEDFVVDDHVVDDHIPPRAGGCCGRLVICVQQASAGCADLQLKTGGRRLEPEPVLCVRARPGGKTQVQPCSRHLREEVVDTDQEPELAGGRPLVSERGRKRGLPGARCTIEDDHLPRRSHGPTVVVGVQPPKNSCGPGVPRGAAIRAAESKGEIAPDHASCAPRSSNGRRGRFTAHVPSRRAGAS